MRALTFTRIQDPSDAKRIAPLVARAFGPRSGLEETLHRWLETSSISVIEGRLGDETAGLSIARWSDGKDWMDGLELEPETLAPYRGKRIATFQLLHVEPAFRQQGVGRQLCMAQYEWMKAEGCQGAIGFAWLHGGDASSVPLFRGAGFELLAELPDYYLTESLERGHICPICQGPCRCPALLFGLMFE